MTMETKKLKIYSQQTGDQESRWVSLNPSPKSGGGQRPSSKTVRPRGRVPSSSAFYSVQAFMGLTEAHPHRPTLSVAIVR